MQCSALAYGYVLRIFTSMMCTSYTRALWLSCLVWLFLPAHGQTDSTAYLKYETSTVETYRIRVTYPDPYNALPASRPAAPVDTTRRKLKVTYQQSPDIEQLANQLIEFNKNAVTAEGYRIQLFTGDRGRAGNAQYQAQSLFPELVCYVDFERPYFKVRLGDFLTRKEAEDTLRLAQETWPGAFIVPSTVNIQR